MLKKILIIIGIFVSLMLLCLAGVYVYIKPDKERFLNFVEENPEKVSISYHRNDSVLIQHNEHVLKPLASTVKIIIAIEYACQAASNKIDANTLVPLAQLEKYYVQNTDGGAHKAWLKSVNDSIKSDAISIREIAKGMINYSSNANTEWLMYELGLDNVNQRLDSLEMSEHTEIYPFVSSLFVASKRSKEQNAENKLDDIPTMSQQDYVALSKEIHEQLQVGNLDKDKLVELDMDIQKEWSKRLPSSTTYEYTQLMKKLNTKSYFGKEVHAYLDEVLERVMQNPKNRTWLKHSGSKGGSTAFVLTRTLYATDKEGNTTELTYFIDDLGIIENFRLQFSMNEFELHVLRDRAFRKKCVQSFSE